MRDRAHISFFVYYDVKKKSLTYVFVYICYIQIKALIAFLNVAVSSVLTSYLVLSNVFDIQQPKCEQKTWHKF